MTKIIGVKIGTKSPHTKDKIYYYKNDKNFKYGDKINIKVETGGVPTATVVIGDSKKKFSRNLKKLEVK